MKLLFGIYIVLIMFQNMITYVIYGLFHKKFKVNSVLNIMITIIISVAYLYAVKKLLGGYCAYVPGLENVY